MKESIKNANEMLRSLQDTMRSLQSELDRSHSHSEQYLSLITDLQKKLDEREKEISDLRDLNNRYKKRTFDNKSTSRKHKRADQKRGRDEEKEDCGERDSASSEKTDSKESEDPLDKTLYERAMKLLNSKRRHYGEMMRKSLSYIINGWEELQNYRKDGRYTIDNMLVERASGLLQYIEKTLCFLVAKKVLKQHWHFSL